ncbi:IclR family transcriptional regulator [Microbacterium sp. X-17]|uniref:IclR family transcriptional regulator n=1 Tax=Microbacterium sp. X-17 TaxID=3144404 RepID=UPI0031F52493
MEGGGIQSVARAFGLLEALEAAGGESGVTELAERTGLAQPTIHRLLQTLTALGYVRRAAGRRYSLGAGLVRLGDSASGLLARWARPVLELVELEAKETANLAALDGDMAVYLAQVPSRHQMRMFTEVGRRVHLHSTGVGKALLAQLPDEEALAIVRRAGMPAFTATTITTEEALLAELRAIRTRGFSVDDGEQEFGVRCVAVPFAGGAGPVAVSVSGPDSRVTAVEVPSLVPLLRRAAAQLHEAFRSPA